MSACETCIGAAVLYLPDGRTKIPCPKCVPDEARWLAARIPMRYFDAPISTLPSAEIPVSRFIYGKPGRGKTRNAVGVLKRYTRARFGGLFVELVALEGQRRSAVGKDEEVMPGEELFTAPFIVADDLIRNVRATDFWTEFMVDLVRARYNANLPTVWTSNFSLEHVAKTFGEWVAGRIGEMCGDRVFEMGGPDWRTGVPQAMALRNDAVSRLKGAGKLPKDYPSE